MKTFKKIQFVAMAILIMTVACEKEESVDPQLMGPPDFSFTSIVGVDMEHPYVQQLWAGQNLDVGEVQVWNDGEIIYVTYLIDDPDWCLTETHLHVANTMEEVPQKNGNPIPGQFDFKEEHDCISEYTYEVPYSEWYCNDDVVIATHAVVKSTLCEQTGVVYGMARNTGEVWGIDVVNGTAWEEFGSIAPPPTSASPNGLAYDGVNERMYYCNYKVGGDPRELYFWDYSTRTEILAGPIGFENAAADFYSGKYYYVSSLPATDDLYEVILNPDGTILSNLIKADMSGNAHNWTFSGDIAINDGILYGWGRCATHDKFEFFSYNLTTGDFTVNQTAFQGFSMQLAFGSNGTLYGHESKTPGNFYEIDISNGNLSAPISITPGTLYTDCSSGMICVNEEEETAWGGEMEFPGKNWATYFNYTIQCDDGTGGDCQGETAWGGATTDETDPWWFYFDTSGEPIQPIWAGQTIDVGTVEYDATAGTLTITLTGGWVLQDVEESVKIQGYDEIPSGRPAAGLFTHYKGSDLVVTIDPYPFYTIHLDVKLCPAP